MFALLITVALSPGTALAAPAAAPPLRLETEVLAQMRQTAGDGTTRVALVPPARVVPGDRMVVQITYRNIGTQSLGGLVIANPVPRGLVYRAPADGVVGELSVDGEVYGALAMLDVALPGGGRRRARADDVTHVRWRLPGTLAAGGMGRLAFEAVVK